MDAAVVVVDEAGHQQRKVAAVALTTVVQSGQLIAHTGTREPTIRADSGGGQGERVLRHWHGAGGVVEHVPGDGGERWVHESEEQRQKDHTASAAADSERV